MTRKKQEDEIKKELNVDIEETKMRDFPVIEHTNNAIIWPEGPKGRIDLNETYEVSSVPEDPDTPMESVKTLKEKKAIPKM
jgi:hypothetical protein